MPILVKYLITAAIVIVVSEMAKRNDQLGALIASLPIVTVITTMLSAASTLISVYKSG